jgi:peptide chain release factor 1
VKLQHFSSTIKSLFHRTAKINLVIPIRYLSSEFSLANKDIEKYLENICLEFHGLKKLDHQNRESSRRMVVLSHIVEIFEERKALLKNLDSLKELADDEDKEILKLMEEEREAYKKILVKIESDIIDTLLEIDESEDYNSLIFEVTAGVGGQEAMLFANELYEMYSNYLDFKGWDVEVLSVDKSDLGGIRHASVVVTGPEAYKYLKYEGGVHRVQRIPATERMGRVHTSTSSIAVIPKPDDFEVDIKDKDLKIETKRASGAGGQHVNTTDSAIRIVHLPTGVAVECQTDRSQTKNREIAMQKLKAKLMQQQLEAKVN